mmetsp:Transcript_27753/g.37069  ORF Transcript_27753/g.37069 Transcript_27753/m.37069 type:complete len:81 (-) Transcript_27753:47-289(-)
MVHSLMSKDKTPKKNRSLMSRLSPKVAPPPQILKFQQQPFQIYTDLEAINRKIDEGEIKLDVANIKSKKTAIDKVESLAN